MFTGYKTHISFFSMIFLCNIFSIDNYLLSYSQRHTEPHLQVNHDCHLISNESLLINPNWKATTNFTNIPNNTSLKEIQSVVLKFSWWSSFGFMSRTRCSDVSEEHTASIFRVTNRIAKVQKWLRKRSGPITWEG